MCLAEALLRIPDDETRDRLIAEKIGSADWASHLGHSDRLFVNASTWGLMLTGKLVDVESEARSASFSTTVMVGFRAPRYRPERSEERRVGNEWVSTSISRWSPYHT